MNEQAKTPPPIDEQFDGLPHTDAPAEHDAPTTAAEAAEEYEDNRPDNVTVDEPLEVKENLQASGKLYLPGEEPAAQPLATIDEHGDTVARRPDPLSMLSAALERGVDIEKLGGLMDLSERYEKNQARKAFALALSDFQGDVPDIVESKLATITMSSGGTYTYSYADLDIIMKAIRPSLKACGLSVRYDADVSDDGKRIRSTCYVMHRDGHTEKTTFTVPLDEGMKVNDSQKMGSANAYACRYNVVNALGLTTGEDDDAGALHGDDPNNRASSATGQAPKPDNIDEFFPIGKHKGKPWDQVPIDYLEWAIANLTDKQDIVERCRRQLDARLDSDDQLAQASAGDVGELSMAECARGITDAKTVAELEQFRGIIPDKHWQGVATFYETRRNELTA